MLTDCEAENPNNRKLTEESKLNVSVPGANNTAKNKPKQKIKIENKTKIARKTCGMGQNRRTMQKGERKQDETNELSLSWMSPRTPRRLRKIMVHRRQHGEVRKGDGDKEKERTEERRK